MVSAMSVSECTLLLLLHASSHSRRAADTAPVHFIHGSGRARRPRPTEKRPAAGRATDSVRPSKTSTATAVTAEAKRGLTIDSSSTGRGHIKLSDTRVGMQLELAVAVQRGVVQWLGEVLSIGQIREPTNQHRVQCSVGSLTR